VVENRLAGEGEPKPEAALLAFRDRFELPLTDEQVQALREAGWTDEQIAEAAYDAALFNLFVRLAGTFGIEPPAVYEPAGIPRAITRESGR